MSYFIPIILLGIAVLLLSAGAIMTNESITRLEGRIRHLENSAHQHQHQP